MILEDDLVRQFEEKPLLGQGWVNAGFFVFQPEIVNYLPNGLSTLEREPLERLAADGQLAAHRHNNLWHAMDTFRDVHVLDKLWSEGSAPWKIWG